MHCELEFCNDLYYVFKVSSPDSAAVFRDGVVGEGGEGKRKIEE